MTTQTKPEGIDQAVEQLAGELEHALGVIATLPVDRIRESKTNPRRVVKDAGFADLVASVKTHGVLQPVLVRPKDDWPDNPNVTSQHYELVAGHRRLAAAREAGITAIPTFVRQLSDLEALEIQVIENLQRSDLHPLEEAQGYQQLIATKRYDVARIAERVGRSAKYIYDRVKLLQLTKDVQKLFLEDRITAGHAIILARLKPEDQARAIKTERYMGGPLFEHEETLFDPEERGTGAESMKLRSVRELQAWVDKHVRFDAREADIPDLFPETYAAVQEATEEKLKIIPITHEHFIQEEAREGRTWGPNSWKRADGLKGSKTCDHSVMGVVVVGGGRGRAFRVCAAKEKCKIHWSAWQQQAAARRRGTQKADTRRESEQDRWKEQRAREQRAREQRAREQRDQERFKKCEPEILKSLAEKISKMSAVATGPLANAIIKPLEEEGFYSRSSGVPRGKTAEDFVRHLAFCIAASGIDSGFYDLADMKKDLAQYGVDLSGIMDRVAPVQTSAKPEASAKKGGKPKRGVCQKCGCTEENACFDEKTRETCSWTDKNKNLCSNCKKPAAPANGVKPPRGQRPRKRGTKK